jgi:hypothetical protein
MPAFDDEHGWAPERPADELLRIARYQRWLVAVVLAQLVLWAGFIALMVLGSREPDGGRAGAAVRFPIMLTLILGGVGGIYVFLLCWELRRGGFVALMLGAATVVPVLGLLVLTLVNGYATTELRKHGIPVGAFGASPTDITNRPSPYDDEDAGW